MPAMEQTHTLREAIRTLGLPYVVGIMSSVSVWKPGEAPLSKTEVEGNGTPHQAVATRQPPSAASGQRPGAQSAGFGLEDRDLAERDKTKPSSLFAALRLLTRRRSTPRNPKASPLSRFTTLVFSWFSSTHRSVQTVPGAVREPVRPNPVSCGDR